MRDIDIRKVLLTSLEKQFRTEEDTLIVQELGLCQGDARVDLAIVNGLIHGYEIKSEKDTLSRLAGQQDVYNKVLDCVTVVAGSRHIANLIKSIPAWWGIIEARSNNNTLSIAELRPSKKNNNLDPSALVQLLWRDEAFSILKKHNLHKGLSKKPRNYLWDVIIDYLSINELQDEIRKKIMSRQHWRSDQIQVLNDD